MDECEKWLMHRLHRTGHHQTWTFTFGQCVRSFVRSLHMVGYALRSLSYSSVMTSCKPSCHNNQPLVLLLGCCCLPSAALSNFSWPLMLFSERKMNSQMLHLDSIDFFLLFHSKKVECSEWNAWWARFSILQMREFETFSSRLSKFWRGKSRRQNRAGYLCR